MTLFINLIKRKKYLCYLFIAVASRILRGDISNWFWLNRAPKSGGVAYNNGRVLSHGGNKVLISGVEGPCWGGVRRNRLQKWKAASLNTGFSSIFDFGGPFKDGSITFTHQLMRGKQKNILPTLIGVHLFFGYTLNNPRLAGAGLALQ
jgi:hypothetical protein